MNDTDTYQGLRRDGVPDIASMTAELHQACEFATTAFERMLRSENTRYCKWADQQDDGRKPDRVANQPARPWSGASDTRIRLADELIVADVRLMKKVVRSGRLMMKGTEGTDYAAAAKTQIYAEHLRQVRMRDTLRRETELAAQWRQTYGYAVTAVTWRQRWTRDFDEMTIEQLAQMAATGQPPAAATLLQLAQDPGRDAARLAANILRQMYPDLDQAEAYKQLAQLRTQGRMRLPVRTLLENRPEWTACKLWRDWFLPYNTDNEQTAPWHAWRVTLTATQLEEKRFSEGWSEEFIAAVRKTTGATVLDEISAGLNQRDREVYRDQEEEMDGLHEVFYFYYEACDEQGLPGKYCTVFSPHLPKPRADEAPLYGKDGPLGYDHGLYPCVIHRREFNERAVVEARSTPEIVHTNQLEVKWQRDAQVNQADLALQPPTIRPEREVGLKLAIRPLGEIGERRAQALRFLPVPPVPPQSTQLEVEARRDAQRYFARNRAEDPVGAGLADEDLVEAWAAELEQCWAMTMQLAQQFEQPMTYIRIVGGRPVPFQLGRDDIRGQHDLRILFNPGNLDAEKLKAKAEIAQTIILPMDRAGTIDWAPVAAGMFGEFFPEFADQAVRSPEQSDAAEVKDEANNWALIMSGTEPDMVENGQNFALRLQWLQGKLQEPGAQARLAQLPDSGQLAQRRLEHLQFMVSQFTTQAQTGRVGVKPQGA